MDDAERKRQADLKSLFDQHQKLLGDLEKWKSDLRYTSAIPAIGIYHRQLCEPYDPEYVDNLVAVHGAKNVTRATRMMWDVIMYAQRRF